jgi:aspartate aminotransferase
MSNLADEMAVQHGADQIHDFSIGNPRIPPPKAYTDALREVASTEEPLCHGYSSTVGDLEPRKEFAKLFTRLQETPVGPEHIILTSGCAGAINITLRVILSIGDEVILIKPYFLEYPFYIENYSGKVVEVDTKFEEGWQINAATLDKAVNPLTRAIIINSPNNPTGVVYTQECIDEVADLLARRSKEFGRPIYIISDDVYIRVIAPGVKCHKIFATYPYSVVCYSVSKDLSIPGERFGCIVCNPLLENVGLLVHVLAHSNEIMGFVHANRLHMRLMPRVLAANATADIHLYNESRDIICRMLDDCGIQYVRPTGAFYIFPKIPDGLDEWTFCEKLARHLVIIVPGRGFMTPGFFRLSYCNPPSDIQRSVPVFKAAFAAVVKEMTGQ